MGSDGGCEGVKRSSGREKGKTTNKKSKTENKKRQRRVEIGSKKTWSGTDEVGGEAARKGLRIAGGA
jgi:hypothetical protein